MEPDMKSVTLSVHKNKYSSILGLGESSKEREVWAEI